MIMYIYAYMYVYMYMIMYIYAYVYMYQHVSSCSIFLSGLHRLYWSLLLKKLTPSIAHCVKLDVGNFRLEVCGEIHDV